jgi:tripartite-type tricarboxylate transporter receptor subunit TctC
MGYSAGYPKRFKEEALRHAIAAVAAFLAILTLLPGRAAAEWPDKPVRVIVPYAAGGANDLLGRVFAEQLSKAFSQQFFVENRTGGGGLIGTEAAARAAPDGSKLFPACRPTCWRRR